MQESFKEKKRIRRARWVGKKQKRFICKEYSYDIESRPMEIECFKV